MSVEQRKRLTIAVELVANPSIVFMDEPTSGQPMAAVKLCSWLLLPACSGLNRCMTPTTLPYVRPLPGLDARAAAIVMRAVRNTVDTGRTVVCTIHQPSIDVFEV